MNDSVSLRRPFVLEAFSAASFVMLCRHGGLHQITGPVARSFFLRYDFTDVFGLRADERRGT